MKKKMMKYLMASCEEAVLLMAKKEERKLSFVERIKLTVHTSMCTLCRRFEKHIRKITGECRGIHAEDRLPLYAREKIEKALRNQ